MPLEKKKKRKFQISEKRSQNKDLNSQVDSTLHDNYTGLNRRWSNAEENIDDNDNTQVDPVFHVGLINISGDNSEVDSNSQYNNNALNRRLPNADEPSSADGNIDHDESTQGEPIFLNTTALDRRLSMKSLIAAKYNLQRICFSHSAPGEHVPKSVKAPAPVALQPGSTIRDALLKVQTTHVRNKA